MLINIKILQTVSAPSSLNTSITTDSQTANLLQNQSQPITITGPNGQQLTVVPGNGINIGQLRSGANIIQVRSLNQY